MVADFWRIQAHKHPNQASPLGWTQWPHPHPQRPWLQNSAPTTWVLLVSMKCETKCILLGLGRWSKQVHRFRGGLGSLAEDCTGSRGHASEQGPTCLRTLAALPGEGQKKKKKRNVLSVEFMDCQKFAAPASVCCYWEHVKTRATEGEVTSSGSKVNRGRNPKAVWETSGVQSARGRLQQWGHGDWQRTDLSLSASGAETRSFHENTEGEIPGGAASHKDGTGSCVCSVAPLHLTPATPPTVAHQAPLSLGFSRQDQWSGWPCPPPGDLPHPGIGSPSPALQVDSLPSEPPGDSQVGS